MPQATRNNKGIVHPARLRAYAFELSRAKGVEYKTAFDLLSRVSIEAGSAVTRLIAEHGAESWQKLPFKAKAAIATSMVRNLLNEKALRGFLGNEKRSIV